MVCRPRSAVRFREALILYPTIGRNRYLGIAFCGFHEFHVARGRC